jgi:microcystin-dependent protein
MADSVNSANMSLPIPVVGTAPGPEWATLLNACLTILDQHSHVSGSGVPITPDAMNINSDLSMSSQNLVDARSLRMTAQASPLALAADLGCIYVSGVDLYYNDVNGNQVRITQSGAVAGTPGSISNLVSPASASYVSGTSTFVWQSAATTPANMDAASLIMRNLSAGSNSLTLQPPAAMGSNSTITLPTLPAATGMVTMDTSGNLSASYSLTDALVPAGVIVAYGGAAAPSGRWLLCDGSTVSRSTYASLFSAIGTAYGNGDGSTTFNVPDMRGRFLRGVSGVSGNDPDASSRTTTTGGNTGNNVGSIQGDQYEAHTHGLSTSSAGGEPLGPGAITYSIYSASTTTGSSGGNETRPINIYVNYIIKY